MTAKLNKTSLILCDTQTLDHGRFAYSRKRLGQASGGKLLGTSWFEILPGKRAFPFHYHLANEEALFVLEGEGTLRHGDEDHPVRPGDYFTFHAGGPGHQVINTGSSPLRYLSFSTMLEPEVAVYPDSKKVGVLARRMNYTSLHKDENAVDDYYEGEE
jgi:uncharacterized cupin superfamily protein